MSLVDRISASGRTTSAASTTQVSTGDNYTASLLDSLSKAAGSYAEYQTSELKKTQEADVVLQRNRAALKQRPTDGATQAGYVAHGVVGVQNKALALSKELEQESKTFEGTDEAWASYTASKFKELQESSLSEYPITDKEQQTNYLGAMTDIFSEQIPRLANVRISDSMEQEQIKRVSTFQDNLLLKMDSLSPEELNGSLPVMLTENKKALQLTQSEVEKVLMNAAVVAAQSGDERLINFTKTYKGEGEVPLFQKYGELQQAAKKAKQVFAADNQGAMAVAKDELITKFEAGDMTFSQLAATVDANAKASGIPLFSDNELLGLKDARQRKIATKTDYNAIIDDNENNEPLAYRYGEKKDRDGLVAALSQRYDGVANQIIARSGNTDPQFVREVKNRTNVELAKKLSDEELVNDDWKNRFKSLNTLNLENTDPVNGTLPANVSEVIDLWYSLDEGSRYAHADGDTSALLSNYELFKSQGQTDVQAIQLAQQSVRNKKVVSHEVRKSAISEANDIADGLTQAIWLEVFSDKQDAPDWYRDRFRTIMSDATFANMQAGYASPEAAAKAAGKAFEANYTRLNNGQLVFGQRKSLAAVMVVNPADIEDTLDAYLQRNKTSLEDEGLGATIDEMYFERPAGRDIVYIRSGINGMPVSGPIPLSQLKLGRDAYLESKKAEEADLDKTESGELRKRFLATGVDMRTEAQKKITGTPVEPEGFKEKKEAETAELKSKLNPTKAGYNLSTKVWEPQGDNIGYGHKLTKEEKSSGFIKIGDTEYNFNDGDSEITDLIATKLMAQDNVKAEKALQLQWKNFDSLSANHKRQLLIMYQAGELTPDTSNKIKKAIEVGTEDLMSIE